MRGGGHGDPRKYKTTAKQLSNQGAYYENNFHSMLLKVEGCKTKDLIGIPWMVAFALRKTGWYLRQDIIWAKANSMPESVKDRCTRSHEYIFLLAKNKKYYFDADAIKEPTTTIGNYGDGIFRNKRDVWAVNNRPFKGEHFATFPEELIKPCVLAGCKPNGVVLHPFMGSGTTGVVAKKYGRNYVGIELNEKYIEIANNRIEEECNINQITMDNWC